MSDPWAFGWTHVLTIFGFAITIAIAVGGFRSFARWKREKLEEKKIEVAFEALSLAYESQYVFDYLRGGGFSSPGGDDWQKRIDECRDFFDRAWKIQPKCMAFFGSEVEGTFKLLHMALMLFQSKRSFLDAHPEHAGKSDAGSAGTRPQIDEIEEFRRRIENICRPTIDRNFMSAALPPPRGYIGRKPGFKTVIRRRPPSSAKG